MEYALYNGLRTAAQPKLKALCEHCGGEVIAKCGTKKIWHWAHTTTDTCDSWNEPETLWHRHWKHVFGEAYSEIRIEKEGHYHIADVVNKDGIVFEFQNSSISSGVIAAREQFYGEKMIWLIHGDSFKSNFTIYDEDFLHHWDLTFLNEFEAAQHYLPYSNGLIIEDWRVKNKFVKQHLNQLDFVTIPEAHIYYLPLKGAVNKRTLEQQIRQEIKTLYETHRPSQDSKKGTFEWLHPRRSWEEAKRPVFIDFGEEYLYRVTAGMGKEKGSGVKILKEKFIEKYGG